MAGLRITNLKKAFGDKTVLDGVSFEVAEGEFCILLGPSGCGKSTVLRLIAGLERQDEGAIFIGGREVSDLTPKERDIAMVFQSYALYPHMSVFENMAFSLKMKKEPNEEIRRKVVASARLLEIEDLLPRRPKDLSGGQRQRVAIGRAIVRNPALFLFDEPLSNLDAKLRTAMRVELAGLHRKLGSTMVYVTHDQVEAMTLGDTIVLLHEGSIQQIGSPADVYERPENVFVASFIGSPPINFIGGTIALDDGRPVFRSPVFTVNVEDVAGLQAHAGDEVLMGIRPEALIPGKGPVKGTISFIEQLGPENILYLSVGDVQLAAKVSSQVQARAGEEVAFALGSRGVHFFVRDRRVGGA